MSFKDHFSERSAAYAAYRPSYPQALVDHLASLCASPDVALDVGCGTGQLSVLLARRFKRVVAIDASAQQIANAEPHERIEYRVAPAERTGLPEYTFDLITVAQAAHWFELPIFYDEVRRVGKPGAILALITYGVLRADSEIDPIVQHFYKDVIGPYWPAERRHVEEGYRSLAFTLEEIDPPSLAIEVQWRADDLIGYSDTWSAVRAAEKVLGRKPMEVFRHDLMEAWGDPERRRTIRFPLSLRIGRI
jgi:ubiquinone/menaquinone biosynthesis C-methylase UbiE